MSKTISEVEASAIRASASRLEHAFAPLSLPGTETAGESVSPREKDAINSTGRNLGRAFASNPNRSNEK